MQRSGDEPLHLLAPRPESARQNGKSRELLVRAEARLRASAARLQGNDMRGQARRAEQFADRVRLGLDHPRAARLLHRLLQDPGAVLLAGTLLDEVLHFGLELLHADRGNVQLADPVTRELRIVAQRGFGADFLDYFAVV